MTQLIQAHHYPASGLPGVSARATAEAHKRRVLKELAEAGSSWYGRLSSESRYLPKMIHPDEHIEAVIYGYDDDGSGMLVATDRRVMYLDKKPLFIKADELSYEVVGGVSYGYLGLFTTVTLHSRVGDFTLRLVSVRCARRFVDFIERRCLEHGQSEARPTWSLL